MINILDILSVFNWKKWIMGLIGGLILAGLIWLTIRPHFKPNPTTAQEAQYMTNNTYNITPRFGCATVKIYGKENKENISSPDSVVDSGSTLPNRGVGKTF